MRHLLLLSFLWISALGVAAQQRKIQHKPFIDERPWHYGFYIGLHDQSLKLNNYGNIHPITGAQWVGENDRQNFGFSVGVLGDWRLSRTFNLRITPGLHFGSKHLTFRDLSTGKEVTQDLKSTFFSLPLHLKASGPRFNNFRPYLLSGVSLQYDLASSKGAMLRTKPLQAFAEIGMGCDFYMPFFKLIPELKFCFGLNNVLRTSRPDLTDPAQLVFTESIRDATPGMVVLTFYFE